MKKTFVILVALVLLTLLTSVSFGSTHVYYDTNDNYYGTSQPTQAELEATGGVPLTSCSTHTHGIFGAVRCYSWNYSVADTDDEKKGSNKLTVANRRCDNCCKAKSIDIPCSRGSGTSYQYSASTTWTVGASWTIVKDIFGVSAGYSDTNSETWGQNEFVSVTIPVTCASEKCKKTGHWPKFDLDIKTYSGPEKYHCWCWYITAQDWLYEGFHTVSGTKTAVHTVRTLMPTSIKIFEDEENDCPTGEPSHCDHDTCVCKDAG